MVILCSVNLKAAFEVDTNFLESKGKYLPNAMEHFIYCVE